MTADGELFDLCDEWGRPLGQAKPRAQVHRDGDWHRSFHCWLLSGDDPVEPSILLQQRALDKDTWPRCWDVSVGGHYAAGEGLDGGLREIREEMGLAVSEHDLVPAARRREVARHEGGVIDREVQDVYFLCRRVDVRVLRPNTEVTAVASVPSGTLVQLADGTLSRALVPGGPVDDRGRIRSTRVEVLAGLLVPRPDGYYARVAAFAALLASGGQPAGPPGWW
jgi:isopentenyldiphosphate isomerase